jgi:hypothetical protein
VTQVVSFIKCDLADLVILARFLRPVLEELSLRLGVLCGLLDLATTEGGLSDLNISVVELRAFKFVSSVDFR